MKITSYFQTQIKNQSKDQFIASLEIIKARANVRKSILAALEDSTETRPCSAQVSLSTDRITTTLDTRSLAEAQSTAAHMAKSDTKILEFIGPIQEQLQDFIAFIQRAIQTMREIKQGTRISARQDKQWEIFTEANKLNEAIIESLTKLKQALRLGFQNAPEFFVDLMLPARLYAKACRQAK